MIYPEFDILKKMINSGLRRSGGIGIYYETFKYFN